MILRLSQKLISKIKAGNLTVLSAIATKEDRGYGRPKEAFKRLSALE